MSTPYNPNVAIVLWEYEDNLPEKIEPESYTAMFEASQVDGVRMYPFIEWNGERIYLGHSFSHPKRPCDSP